MRTVGQLLKEARNKKGFTLTQVEKSTKIRERFLTAIENDDYRRMPASPYIQGFVKNYSDFLGLPTSTVLALFRRQFKENERLQKRIEEPLETSGWKLTPNRVIFTLILILAGALMTYFYFQYRQLQVPPPLILAQPQNELVTKETTLAIFGDTDRDAIVTINQEPVLVKDDGKFYKDVPLSLGNNTFIVEATNRNGKKTVEVRQISRIP